MSLRAIIGHEQPLRVLRRAFADRRVPTAYLFVGPPNVGKYTVALELAKLLNCTDLRGADQPDALDCCDECRACRRIQAGNFPDVLAVRPVVRIGSGAQAEMTEFEGAILTTEQIGDAISRAGLKLSRGKHKVIIIAQAETMNPEAANRLLKTLEEPPPRTTLVLTTSNVSALLPTVVSRCQRVTFHPVPMATLLAELGQRVEGVAQEVVETVAGLCGGRPGWALALLRSPDAMGVRGELLELLVRLADEELIAALPLAEELIGLAERWWLALNAEAEAAEDVLRRSGDRVRRLALCQLLDLLASLLRDMILLLAGADELILNKDATDTLRALAGRGSMERLHRAAMAVNQAQRHLRGNANVRLACELLLLQVMQSYRAGVRA